MTGRGERTSSDFRLRLKREKLKKRSENIVVRLIFFCILQFNEKKTLFNLENRLT
jgi:hypothetical protein